MSNNHASYQGGSDSRDRDRNYSPNTHQHNQHQQSSPRRHHQSRQDYNPAGHRPTSKSPSHLHPRTNHRLGEPIGQYHSTDANEIVAQITATIAPLNLPTQSTQPLTEEADPETQMKRYNDTLHAKKLSCYELYLTAVPKHQRNKALKHANHPQTPPSNVKMSKRQWVGKYDQWVGLLKGWDNGGTGYNSLDEMKAARVNRLIESNGQRDRTTQQQNVAQAPQDGTTHIDQNNDEEDEALAEAMRLAEAF